MNKFNRAAINYFGEKKNREYLKSKLITYFSSGKYVGYPGTSKICAEYINKTLDKHMYSYIQLVERDFLYTPLVTERYPSDQNPGDQVACLNMKFTEHMIDLIEGDLLNWDRRQEYVGNASYTVNDGLNASSKTIVGHAPRSVLRDKDTRIVDDPMFHYHTKSDIWGGVVGGGENTTNNAIKLASIPNNILNANGQPSDFNSSKWIEMFSTRPSNQQNLASTSSWQSSAVQIPDRANRADDINKKTCEIKGFKFARANKLQPLSAETKSADAEVNKWWYPVSPLNTIRDDPVGELNRDRGVESGGISQRNQVEFPYGNASGWGGISFPQQKQSFWRGSSLVQNVTHSTRESNPNESRRFTQHPLHVSGTQPLYSAVPSAKGFVFDTSDTATQENDCPVSGSLRTYHRNVVSEGFSSKSPQNIELPSGKKQGNSLAAYSPTNKEISSGHSFSGVIDPTNLGDENNRFTGESPEFAGNHLDRLLGTPYIQTLNTQYGDAPRQQAVSSCYDRGKYGAKMLAGGERSSPCKSSAFAKPDSEFSGARPQNSVMFWQIGDGFVDQKNDALMERLNSRRIFRSFNRGCDFKEVKTPDGKSITITNPHGNSASDQIPWFERALYNRYYERDVEEAVGGFELDNLSRGYGKDMMSLYCRVQKKNLNPLSCGKTNPPYPKGNREIPLPSGYNQVTYENSNKTYPPWAFYSPK